jgi:SAM-dependent methyltransferase
MPMETDMDTDLRLCCAICGTDENAALCIHPDFGVHQFRCRSCDQLQTVGPSDSFLRWYYAQTYREEREETLTPGYRAFAAGRAEAQLRYIHGVAERRAIDVRPARVLEIGAGCGALLGLFDAERVAIEPDEAFAQDLLQSHPEVSVITWDELASQPDPAEHFDLVLMSHVLEHLPDPVRKMRLIHDRLTCGGLLFVEVPHEPQSFLEYMATTAQRGLAHLFHFEPASLQRLLVDQSGFSTLDVLTTGITIDEFIGGAAGNPAISEPVENGSTLRALVQRSRDDDWHEPGAASPGADVDYYQRALFLQSKELAVRLNRIMELYEKLLVLSEYVTNNPPPAQSGGEEDAG